MKTQLTRGIGVAQMIRRQKGVTLIEMLIGLALSLIVTSSMVVLMSNSLGTATRITQMSQLTDELRNTMSMLSRDVRRANYNPYALYCYANPDCGVDDSTVRVNFINDLNSVAYQGNTCLVYFLQREDEDYGDGDPGNISGGGFRLVTDGGVGWVEMWTGGVEEVAPPADCTGNSWIPVTDPGFVNITELTVNDDDGSFENTVNRLDGSVMLTQRVRQIRVQLRGELLIDDTISRRIEDVIRVRNDFIQSS
jgi:prepilin-type N-terminal cleavage/methylation domain-containing protein